MPWRWPRPRPRASSDLEPGAPGQPHNDLAQGRIIINRSADDPGLRSTVRATWEAVVAPVQDRSRAGVPRPGLRRVAPDEQDAEDPATTRRLAPGAA